MQILTQLSEPFLSACAKLRSAKRKLYKDKDSIYVRRPTRKAYVVKKGYVRLVSISQDGRLWTRMVFGKGALLGDLPFHPGFFVTDEQAISSGATCLFEIDRDDLEQVATTNPDFQHLLLKTMSSQLQFVDRRLQWQLISPLRTRVAMALADLVCFTGGHCGHGHLVDVRLTHEEFAQYVVAARPVVSEVLKEFKAAGIIDYTRSHLCLLDLRQLCSIAGTSKR